MKKGFKSVAGVTLLEIMLVLAIAAMIIVMSIRYYQSANASQQANSVTEMVTAIVAAADGLAQPVGSYKTAGVSKDSIAPLLPATGLTTPWQTSVDVAATGDNTFTITIPSTPAAVCPLVVAKLKADNHFTQTAPTACNASSTTNLVITYTSNV